MRAGLEVIQEAEEWLRAGEETNQGQTPDHDRTQGNRAQESGALEQQAAPKGPWGLKPESAWPRTEAAAGTRRSPEVRGPSSGSGEARTLPLRLRGPT